MSEETSDALPVEQASLEHKKQPDFGDFDDFEDGDVQTHQSEKNTDFDDFDEVENFVPQPTIQDDFDDFELPPQPPVKQPDDFDFEVPQAQKVEEPPKPPTPTKPFLTGTKEDILQEILSNLVVSFPIPQRDIKLSQEEGFESDPQPLSPNNMFGLKPLPEQKKRNIGVFPNILSALELSLNGHIEAVSSGVYFLDPVLKRNLDNLTNYSVQELIEIKVSLGAAVQDYARSWAYDKMIKYSETKLKEIDIQISHLLDQEA